MSNTIFYNFKKNNELLICVDSDGCAMDTMNCKHFYCFGPAMVDEWELSEWREDILQRWNEINLYQMTRGINRFSGLAMALSEINESYKRIEGLDALLEWTKTTHALSNGALEEAIQSMPAGEGKNCLEKALSWSNELNKRIVELPPQLKIPFPGAKEGLAEAHKHADIAVVSSANRAAVEEEWSEHGLLTSVDILLAQDVGSKAFCIKKMLEFGYDKQNVLMVGDAPGDLDAAEKNDVRFFPILVGKEEYSWNSLTNEALPRLRGGSFTDEYQKELKAAFIKNLGG